MPISLSKEHRKLLEKTTAAARILAESACRAALENLAVHEKTFWPNMSNEQKQLRNRLRARGRALGDARDKKSNTQEIRRLTEAAAYEHWHRLLFTRFLTENNLLITDEVNGNVPVTLEECEELLQAGKPKALLGGWVFQRSMPLARLRFIHAPQAEDVGAAAAGLSGLGRWSLISVHLRPVYHCVVRASSGHRQEGVGIWPVSTNLDR